MILLGSALFSAIEAALFSIPVNKVKILNDEKKEGASVLLRIKNEMRPTITVLVLFTNIFNIAGSILAGVIAANILNSTKIGIFSAILTFLVIVFAEILPKSFGDAYAERISLLVAKPLFYTTKLFSPLIWIILTITNPLPKKKKNISEEDIRSLSHIGYLEGVIEKDEKEMIQKVFLLNDLKAKDIMTPRIMITSFQADKKLKNLEEKIYSLSHSRIPIYRKDMDDIIGISHQRDLLIACSKGEKEKKVSEFTTNEAIFVSEETKIDNLIPIFREQRCHLAVVVDQFGGTSGVVTLEDVLEQLIGEVIDETDKTVNLRKKAEKIQKRAGK